MITMATDNTTTIPNPAIKEIFALSILNYRRCFRN